ncbi:serine protease [Borealophlyctis nickersoniae]|nr:serine protease [Borealophlyctis nickersoniae]
MLVIKSLPTFLLLLPAVLALPQQWSILRTNGRDTILIQDPTKQAPLLSAENAQVLDDKYMVVLKDANVEGHRMWLNSLMTTLDASTYSQPRWFNIPGMQGYSGSFPEDVISAIRATADVEFVEKDQIVHAIAHPAPFFNDEAVQKDAPWGLGRISHREHPVGNDTHKYLYPDNAGQGVTVYVVDTGVSIHHVDFEDRAAWGATIPEGDFDIDGNGHGTHVAGTIAGKKYGVAKKANIVAVKVLRSNGSGTMSDVVKGIEWVIENHKNRTEEADKKEKVKSAANMSLGGGMSRILNRAVNAAVDAGVAFAVAAGNDDQDACNYSPASAEKAVTVGATTIDDLRAWFSNWGKCVDVFAPGHQILSAWIGSNVATNTISGTSMASPHVAGILADWLSRDENEKLGPLQLKKKLIQTATLHILTGLPKKTHTKNRFVYSLPPNATKWW